MSNLNSKNFSTNLSSSIGDNLPPIENEGKPFLLNQRTGVAGEYQEVLESLQEALVNYYDTIPEKNKELASKVIAKLALPVKRAEERGSSAVLGYIPIMNMVPTKTSKRKVLKKDDRVNHPSHYTWLKELCGVEVIDITRHMDFDLGNAIKYILRQGHKTEKGISDTDKAIEDLQKAIFYIEDKIAMLKKISL